MQAKGGVVDMHIHDERALIALQGPKAATALQVCAVFEVAPCVYAATNALALQSLTKLDLSKFHFGMFATVDVAGAHCFVTRTGYTGEDGFEISVPNEKALHLTERLCANNFVKLCGECRPWVAWRM